MRVASQKKRFTQHITEESEIGIEIDGKPKKKRDATNCGFDKYIPVFFVLLFANGFFCLIPVHCRNVLQNKSNEIRSYHRKQTR